MKRDGVGRRQFAESLAGAALSLQAPEKLPAAPTSGKLVGIQVGAVSFVDEGVEKVFDNLQELGRVNCVSLSVFTYANGTGGRQISGHPLPDHGGQEYDRNWRGGNFSVVHPEYYKDTGLDPQVTRATEHGAWDFLASVTPSARKRGMKILAWITDKWRRDIPGIEKLMETDLGGRPAQGASITCHNNPYHRNLMLGVVTDYLRSYDVDGILYCQERSGPVEASLGGRGNGQVTCFCAFCRQEAEARGISVDRARTGYRELESFVRASRAGTRPVDGYYVTFWRLLLRYPEILAWETLYQDSINKTYRLLYERVKSLKPEGWFGLHIAHQIAFSPIHRATQDTSELVKYADFLKIVMYQNCAGPRFVQYVEQRCQDVYRDAPPAQMGEFLYRVMNYQEAPYERVARAGFNHDYVYRESKRAVDGAAGSKTRIFPGLDIDIPTAPNESQCTPENVKSAVLQAFRAGAHGVILSRKYSEMKLANLAGAGAAIKELGLA